ncbi:von Willebrand factor-like [Anopheles albimanus]|uniref:von Willebrand factor-like n=1 Tax=Anopheles albimanus TaxID=7167 RepID=UPI00163E8855|nr:von Willebrand factor-like [Anopheles albimanus]
MPRCGFLSLLLIVSLGLATNVDAIADVDQQPAADAPVETTNAPSPVCSGQYERYDDCGNPCSERTCENLRRIDLHCSKQCVAGCYCQNGYVRKVPDGTCIPKIRCALNPL